MDYVQVHPQFSFAALNSRWPWTLICITAYAMSHRVVNDLAKAMKALDGKKIDFVVTPFSFVVRSSLSLLPLCFGVSCPFPVSRLTVSPVLSLLAFPLFPASDSSGRRLVWVVRALAPPLSLSLLFCFLLHPRVLCLVFLAADWSGFPAPPSSPSFLPSFTSLIPDLFSRRDLRLSVIFSGRRLVRGITLLAPQSNNPLLQTRHVL